MFPSVGPIRPIVDIESAFAEHENLWTELMHRLTKDYGQTDAKAHVMCRELFRVLYCMSCVEDTTDLGIPEDLDIAWHLAILNTRLYAQLCDLEFGRFIHHSTVTMDDTDASKLARINRTGAIYRRLFGKFIFPEAWPRPSDGPLREASFGGPASKRARSASEIHFVTMTGKRFSVSATEHTSFWRIKQLIQEKVGFHPDMIRIIEGGVSFADTDTIDSVGRSMDTVFHVVINLRGC